MEQIAVHDKHFKVSISPEEIAERVGEMALEITRDLHGKNPLFLSVLNGAFVFTSDLVRAIPEVCEVEFVKLKSYEGTGSTGKVKEAIGLPELVAGRHVVIVEDIVDTGLTMAHLRSQLNEKGAETVRICTLLMKPGKFEGDYKVDYVGYEIPDDFVVGYGLDYDGHGRNLPAIYTVTD